MSLGLVERGAATPRIAEEQGPIAIVELAPTQSVGSVAEPLQQGNLCGPDGLHDKSIIRTKTIASKELALIKPSFYQIVR